MRNIGTGRNMARKSKTAARMEAIGTLNTGSGGDIEAADDDDADADADRGAVDTSAIFARIGYRSKFAITQIRSSRMMNGCLPADTQKSRDPDAYETLDAMLEGAQKMCERGAHQILRDGDCRAEINTALKKLQQALALCEGKVPKTEDKVHTEPATADPQPESIEDDMQLDNYKLATGHQVLPDEQLSDPKVVAIDLDEIAKGAKTPIVSQIHMIPT